MACALKMERGHPLPLGASRLSTEVNFSVFSQAAEGMRLCLFSPEEETPLMELELDPLENRTGYIWHVAVEQVPLDACYAWRTKQVGQDWGPCVLDPYAKGLSGRDLWAEGEAYAPRGIIMENAEFDWEGVSPPRHRLRDLVIYEMHVRGFTRDPSSGVVHPGTYAGVAERIPHLKKLGVNAIELLPVQEFNELEYLGHNPETGQRLLNFWGYSTVNFFCPMSRYASNSAADQVRQEFREMVRECHRAGIEVILDVVFNHTAEGNHLGPTLSFRGLDEKTYYSMDEKGRHMNFSGCGNTLNCNHAVVREFIRDCLRYWVTEYRIDGFRFDLASVLGRDEDGTPLSYSPLIDGLSRDPFLAQSKLIAEAWDAGGLYQVGSFFPEYGRWAEWNGCYRDNVRKFIKGTSGAAAAFATKAAGSQDLYNGHRGPYQSINFITAHDGFSLRDLVSYNHKHNLENGEDNRDGANDNLSWNCGIEGPSNDPKIELFRQRQMRNFHVALMISQGVPMVHMGDEYGHTKGGNNNTWCQDNRKNWFCWDQLEKEDNFFRFYRLMIDFRNRHELLRRKCFLGENDVDWHDWNPYQPDWDHHSRFVAFTLKNHQTGEDIYVAFNSHYESAMVKIPNRGDGREWFWVVDTSQPSPNDILEEGQERRLETHELRMTEHSAWVLKAMPV